MQIQYIQKPTSLVYVWAFIPTFNSLAEKLVHEIEHKLFFSKHLKALLGDDHFLSKNQIEVSGSAYYSGIRLEFALIPDLLPKLLHTLEKMLKSPLPNWNNAESLRFQKELEEDDSFTRLTMQYKEKCIGFNLNKKRTSVRKIWENEFDIKNTRVLIVGNFSEKKVTSSWKKTNTQKIQTTHNEKRYIDWYQTKDNYNYTVFFSANSTPTDYVKIRILQNMIYEDLVKQFIKTGRAYTITVQNSFESEFIVSIFDIDTNDKIVNTPKLNTTLSKKYFAEILQKTIFEELSDNDVQAYGCFPIIGFMPDKIRQAYETITYEEFSEFYKKKTKEISFYWC